MKTGKVWLDALVVGERHRKVDDAKVSSLAESMAAIGLQQPISVWFDDDDAMHLVAGLHRVRAAEKLKWDQIDAVTVELDETDRERWEIAENLHRADLTALERDEHVARWIELTEQASAKAAAHSGKDVRGTGAGISCQSDTKIGRGRPATGINQAARDLNVPGKTEEAKRVNAHRAVKVASISEQAKQAARETGLDDNRTVLLKAARETEPEKQAQVIHAAAARKAEPKPETPDLIAICEGLERKLTVRELIDLGGMLIQRAKARAA